MIGYKTTWNKLEKEAPFTKAESVSINTTEAIDIGISGLIFDNRCLSDLLQIAFISSVTTPRPIEKTKKPREI